MEKLVNEMNGFAEMMEELETCTINSGYADYCESFGYGEGGGDEILDAVKKAFTDNGQDDELEIIVNHLESLQDSDLIYLIGNHSTISKGNMYNERGQVFAVSLGECEFEISEELMEEYNDLSSDDQNLLEMQLDFHLSKGYGYIDLSYTYFRMILDTDSLMEALTNDPSLELQA